MTTTSVRYIAIVGAVLALLLGASVASSWTGPSQTAPNGNVSAPINVGTTDQVKDAGLSVNSLAVFGNAILSGTTNYLNFGTTAGSSGYGVRNSSGTLEFKNSGGSWESLQTIINNYISLAGQWTTSGSDVYRSSGNVGIGGAPSQRLDVQGGAIRQVFNTTYDVWIQGGASTAGGDARNLAILGIDEDSGDYLWVNYGSEYGAGTYIGGPTYSSSFLYSSDARMKHDVTVLRSALGTLLELRPVTFIWNDSTDKAGEADTGLIAQEVQKVLPHVVTEGPNGMLSVDYIRLVPFLVGAIQEQQREIDALRHKIELIEAR